MAEEDKPQKTEHDTPNIKNTSIAITAIVLIGIFWLSKFSFDKAVEKSVVQSASQNATIISSFIREFREIYTEEVVDKVKEFGIYASHEFHSSPNLIPLPASASLVLGEKLNTNDLGVNVDLVSPYPFPWRQNQMSELEKKAWEHLANSQKSEFTEVTDSGYFFMATPDRMIESCVGCHNSHPDTPKSGWKVGDLRGMLVVKVELNTLKQNALKALEFNQFIQVFILAIISSIVLSLFIRQFNAKLRLSDAVSQRTEQLEAEKYKAEEATKVKSEFLATMSHEIRTPMNGVIGMLNVLQQSELSNMQKNQVDTAHSSAHSLLKIINSILDFSKIEAGKLELSPQPFLLSRFFEELNGLFEIMAKKKKIKFVINTQNILIDSVSGDQGKLRQVLINIIGNAVKFTNQGEVLVTVTTQSVSSTMCKLNVEVKDSGIGIETDQQEHLFGLFTQADSSNTRGFGGTGLGLTISKQLIELMGGTISVSSEIGKGTSFTFDVLLDSLNQGQFSDEKTIVSKVEEKTNTFSSGFRILVAEDNHINQIVIKAILDTFDLECDIAENGQLAIDCLLDTQEGHPYSIVLMDCQMPEMDGFEATKLIRAGAAGEQNKTLPIIAITAGAIKGDEEKCKEVGMDGYLTKPIDGELLFDTLKKYAPPC